MNRTFVLLAFLLTAGCNRAPAEPAAGPPPVGGGDRKVVGIMILEKGRHSLKKEDRPKTIQVGKTLALEVIASWAIPSITHDTDKAVFSVNDDTIGTVDDKAVFTARKAGKITIMATVRVARGSTNEVLGPKEKPPAGRKVDVLKDQLVLTIVE